MAERGDGSSLPITACVINYQGERRLEVTIGALLDATPAVAELILVDSASDDGSVELVRRSYPMVRIVPLPENRGPAAARNRGFEVARHDRILFVDNDVTLHPRCPVRLHEALDSHGDAVIALPQVRLRDAPDRIQFEGAGMHISGLMKLGREGCPTGDDVGPRAVGSMVSACFLLDRSRWGLEPPFDESFAFNYEDHDLGTRARIRGHRILAIPSAKCLHGDGTPGYSVRGDEPYPSIRVYELIRGRWLILLKTLRPRSLLVLAPVLALFELLQVAIVVRRGWGREWVRALTWIVSNRREVLGRRRALQAVRRLDDRELLEGGRLPVRLPRGGLENAVLRVFDRFSAAYWSVARRAI